METIITRFKNVVNTQDDPVIDGKIHRFGKKDAGWYVGHTWTYKGQDYSIIKVGSWNGLVQNTTIKSWDAKIEDTGFRKKFSDITKEAEIKLKIENHEKNKSCKEKWKPIFDSCPHGDHPYLRNKQISHFNSKIDMHDVLLIPAYDHEGFVGVQRIFSDPESGQMVKRFSSGIKLDGAICPLKPFRNEKFCFLSEGFATAASIQMAFPNIPSICGFNAQNLTKAIATIKHINSDIKIMIAADRDKNKTGEIYAKKCMNMFPDVIFRLPELESDQWTDFNDLHCFNSIQAVKDQLEFDDSDFASITPIGYNENYFYYTSSHFKLIMALSPQHHKKVNLFALAPQKYWVKKYGVETEEGEMIVSYDSVASDLMEKCREKGVFDPEKIRGTGVWLDSGSYVINNGTNLIPGIQTDLHYQGGKEIKDYSLKEELSDEDALKIVGSFNLLKYKRPKDYIYLVAFMVQSGIFSVIPWRFHLWLSGEKGTGKSEILKWFSQIMINPYPLITATEAGIRQNLRSDARPVVFDEAEGDGSKIKGVVELARTLSSNNGFQSVRGTSGGKAINYNTQACFCMGSIQTATLNAADRSRFFVVEMDTTEGQSPEEFANISWNMEKAAEMKSQIFCRAFNNIQTIVYNFRVIKKVLKDKKLSSRSADQIGMALACFAIMESKDKMTPEIAEKLIEYSEIYDSEFAQENKSKEHEDCLDAIMSTIITNQNETIGFLISKINEATFDTEHLERPLAAYGIKYFKKEREIFISVNRNLLSKIKEYPDYLRILRRHSSILVDQRSTIKLNGSSKKGIKLKMK